MHVSPDDEGYIARGVGSPQTDGGGGCQGATGRGVAYPNRARPQRLDKGCRTSLELLFGITMPGLDSLQTENV